jgi:aspartate aminotransferase-like enzyme
MSRSSGRHFLQIPGPTNTPLSILAAIAKPTIDHRGPEFAGLGLDVLKRIRAVFKTEGPVIIYPTSRTGAWEAALVNTHSPGNRVLMFETGWFSTLSSSLTAVRLPQGHPADALRRQILEDANLSLGNGLGPLADRVFRIGHLGLPPGRSWCRSYF